MYIYEKVSSFIQIKECEKEKFLIYNPIESV